MCVCVYIYICMLIVSIRIYFGLSHCVLVLSIVFACLSAMIALLLFGFLVIVAVVDATHAYGHVIVFRLPDMSPLWPLRFAIAGTLVSLLLGSWLFRLWRNQRT